MFLNKEKKMAVINVYLNIPILSVVRIVLPSGAEGSHLLIDDAHLLALKASGLADFIEGDKDDKGEVKEVPAKWLKDGHVLHEYLGLTINTTKVDATPIEVEPKEIIK
jgi:hypothetical protein